MKGKYLLASILGILVVNCALAQDTLYGKVADYYDKPIPPDAVFVDTTDSKDSASKGNEKTTKTTESVQIERCQGPARADLVWYGFVRNYFTFDTRESKAGTDELYYYVPLDESVQADGTDINAHPTMKWSAITSRIGLDIWDYIINEHLVVDGKIEADFYSGLTGVTGTAQFRLRQAYTVLAWCDDREAPMNTYSLKVGQAWHPMAADMVHSTNLEIGVPFAPFSRTPQITFNYHPGRPFSLTASALWQMQYTSGGPEGASANYIKYSNIPEFYFGVNFKGDNGLLARVGVDLLSIKPRYKGEASMLQNGDTVKYTALVDDRITTFSPFVYMQYKGDKFQFRAKSILAQAGEHMNLNGGYGVTAKSNGLDEDGHWEYTPVRYSSSWVSMMYGKKWQGILFAGYAKNLGTADALLVDYTDTEGNEYANIANNYLSKNTYANINSMWRLAPGVVRNWGKLALSLEWHITSVQYGEFVKQGKDSFVSAKNGMAENNLHWITNHRLQMMLKYSF
ncbi:MAG: hypothetical protein J6Y55_02620 [Bacteroidales bacterium]|nr:hypothetical protein [Bacteroidales bacterium]